MNKFKKYIRDCKNCIDMVDVALSRGAVLTPDEKMDYYFKTLCNYRMEVKKLIEPEYRLAYFYSKVMSLMQGISCEGYYNEEVFEVFKKICSWSKMLNGKGVDDVDGYDENGSLFVEVGISKKEEYYCYEIRGVKSLLESIADFAGYLVQSTLKVSEYAEKYMQNILSEVLEGKNPVPYTNMEDSMTLSANLYKNSNVIRVSNFDNIGGNTNGRCNERGSEKRRVIAGI